MNSGIRWKGPMLCALILVSGALVSPLLFGSRTGIVGAAGTGLMFSYVVNIWMENKNYGSVLSGNSCCPYENQLANTYSTDPSYGDIVSPSLPNYLGFMGGSYPSCATGDGDPSSCSAGSQVNLVDRLEASGLTWKAYAENYPVSQGCTTAGSSGGWYARHFPFNYYSDILNNAARCADLNNAGGSDSNFLAALNTTSGWPNFVWLTPNGCNDTHDCVASTGDRYLSGLVPKILNSSLFKTGKAVLVITWDEYNPAPNIEAGCCVNLAYKSTTVYNHYSWLKTLELNWALASLTSNDAGAKAMTDIFTASGPAPLSTSFTFTLGTLQTGQSISFDALAIGGTAPYTFSWNFGDSSTGTAATTTHTYPSAGQYRVNLTATDSAGLTATFSQTVTVNAPGALSASFSYSPSSPTNGTIISFTSTVSGGVSPYVYRWSFGDGSTANSANPTHTYVSSGSYNATLTATDSAGHIATDSKIVTVASVSGRPAALHVDGSRIVDVNGAPVILVGINYGDYPNDVPPNEFNTGNLTLDALNIKAAGFNTVNLVEEWGSLENSASASSFTYKAASMSLLQARISALTAQGVYVIVKLHSDAYTSSQAQNLAVFLGSQYCGSSGRFSDSFYSTSAASNSTDGMAHLTRLFLAISNMTKNNSLLIGYDLLNEPIACNTTTTNASQEHAWWYSRVTEITAAIRRNGDNRVIFVEEAPYNAYYVHFQPYPDPNTVSSAHFYRDEYKTSGGSWAACSGDYATLYDYYSNVGGPSGTSCSTVPISLLQAQLAYPNSAFMVGEFGDIYGNSPGDVDERWILDSVQLFRNENLVGWLYWSQGDTGTWIKDLGSTASGPDFSVSARPTVISIVQGSSGNIVITLASLSGYAGIVNLTLSLSAATVTTSLSQKWVNVSSGGIGTSTLSISTSPSTPAGTYSGRITGTSGLLSHSATISVTIILPPDFSLVASPSSISIPAGSAGYVTLTVVGLNSFSGSLTLTASVSSSELTAVLSASSLSVSNGGRASSSLTISTSSSAAAGAYSLNVNGQSLGFSHGATITVTITPPPVNPLTESFSWSPINPTANQTVVFTASASNGVQPYIFKWSFGDGSMGSGPTVNHAYAFSGSYTIKLVVIDASNITVSSQSIMSVLVSGSVPVALVVPGSMTASPGTMLTFTVSASNPKNSSPISISAPSLPPGAVFTSTAGNPATGEFSWNPSSTAQAGSYNITFRAVQAGSSYSSSKTVTIDVSGGQSTPCFLCRLTWLWQTVSLVMIGATVGLLVTVASLHLVRGIGVRPKGLPSVGPKRSSMPARVRRTPTYGTGRIYSGSVLKPDLRKVADSKRSLRTGRGRPRAGGVPAKRYRSR